MTIAGFLRGAGVEAPSVGSRLRQQALFHALNDWLPAATDLLRSKWDNRRVMRDVAIMHKVSNERFRGPQGLDQDIGRSTHQIEIHFASVGLSADSTDSPMHV